MTRGALIRKLDKVFSEWVRRRGESSCFTCRKQRPWKELHAGHFMPRQHYATRWEPMNVQPQCAYCNTFRAGEQYRYGKRLDEVYGPGTADSLERASKTIVKWPAWQLREEIERIQGLLKALPES